jgi:hypothetical protein
VTARKQFFDRPAKLPFEKTLATFFIASRADGIFRMEVLNLHAMAVGPDIGGLLRFLYG